MLSNQLFQQALSELSGMIRTDFALLDEKTHLIASTFTLPDEVCISAAQLWENNSISQSIPAPDGFSYHFFKLIDQPDKPLLLIAHGPAADAYTGGCIASSQIKFLLRAGEEQVNREQFLLRFLTEPSAPANLSHRARQLRLSADSAYSLILISIDRFGSVDFHTILRQLFVESSHDTCVVLGSGQFALIRDLSRTADADEYPAVTAPIIADTLSSEAMAQFRIAYSGIARSLADLPRVYHEASLALEAGKLFFPERHILPYHALGIGRLICQMPLPLCRSFAQDIFGEQFPVFDEELLSTINRFFKNSLNISETARQLFLHRNTLVYRLERVQKMTGLDIRNFEDALTFRIAWMAASRVQAAPDIPDNIVSE